MPESCDMANLNPNCDGSHCQNATGEVRVLPLGKSAHHGNLILCHSCYYHEITWRKEENKRLAADAHYLLPTWDSLATYP